MKSWKFYLSTLGYIASEIWVSNEGTEWECFGAILTNDFIDTDDFNTVFMPTKEVKMTAKSLTATLKIM